MDWIEPMVHPALERMCQWERLWQWLEREPLSPPVWPVAIGEAAVVPMPADHSLVETQYYTTINQVQSITDVAGDVMNVAQGERLHQLVTEVHSNSDRRTRDHQQQYATQSHALLEQSNQMEAVYQHSLVQDRVQVATGKDGVVAKENAPFVASHQQACQTTVTVSPTIHLQATVYEQADVDALVNRLGRLLEEEIAISAERAYR